MYFECDVKSSKSKLYPANPEPRQPSLLEVVLRALLIEERREAALPILHYTLPVNFEPAFVTVKEISVACDAVDRNEDGCLVEELLLIPVI